MATDPKFSGDARTVAITASGLKAGYGDAQVLHSLSLHVDKHEIVTLLGRNGAGKSTTLKSIMGLIASRTGSIKIGGAEVIDLPPEKIARAGVAYCPEDRGIYASLTVEENLLLPPVMFPGGLTLEKIFSLFPNLRERLKTQGTKLSGGEQQMLAIARILRTGAKTLLLDEPTEGLAPVIIAQIGHTLEELRTLGYTILLVEQNFRFASQISDRHYIVEHGQIVDEISRSEVPGNQKKIENFLGV